MAVRRQNNWLGQERVDVSDMRAIDSGVAADFDVLAGKIMAGRAPLVVRGFTLSVASAVGNPATQLQLSVAAGLILHFGASESGTLFVVDDNKAAELLAPTNANVSGSFTASSTNYIGLDFVRSTDSTTSDLKQFIDADTVAEIAKTVPTARTLGYKIVISTQPFSVSSNVCPIAKVVTNSANNVTSITDARPMMFRLGNGSDTPSGQSSFSWPDSTRAENPVSTTSSTDPFSGGDKGILSLKNWMDAIMSRLWEVGGGQYWYSATSRDNVKLVYGQPVIVATSDNWQWDAVTAGGTLTWKSLTAVFENSPTYINTIQDGSAVLNADGQCLYVDLVRSAPSTVVPAVGTLTSLPAPAIPGTRFIVAWRSGGYIFVRDRPYEVGRVLNKATTAVYGSVILSGANTPDVSATVPALDSAGSITIAASSGNTNAITATGSGTGSGVFSQGGTNTNTGGPTGSTFTPGPGNGGAFIGAQGTGGGDGIQGFGRGTQTTRSGVWGQGNTPTLSTTTGGSGGFFTGGNGATNGSAAGGTGVTSSGGNGSATGTGATGGDGVSATGGTGGAGGGNGGHGGRFVGGSSTTASANGSGIRVTGGAGTTATGGDGITAAGGTATVSSGKDGGKGANIVGGAGDGVGFGGIGALITGGAAGGSGTGGTALYLIPGSGTNDAIHSQGCFKFQSMSNVAPTTAPGANTLWPSNIVKMHGQISINGTTVSIVGGFGMLATPVIAGDAITITFQHAMADQFYTVIGNVRNRVGNHPKLFSCISRLTTSVSFEAYEVDGTTPVTGAADLIFDFTVIGNQAL